MTKDQLYQYEDKQAEEYMKIIKKRGEKILDLNQMEIPGLPEMEAF